MGQHGYIETENRRPGLSFHFPPMTKVLFQYKGRSDLVFVTGLIIFLNYSIIFKNGLDAAPKA